MGHRQGFSTERNHMHSEDPFVHLGSSSAVENNSFLHPSNNLLTDGLQYISHWNPAVRENEFCSSSQVLHAQSNQIIGSSTHTSLHLPLPVDVPLVPENHLHHMASSNCIVENNLFDHTMPNRIEQYKRKSTMVPSITEMGSTSGYYYAGSSSDACYGIQNANVQNTSWEPVSIPPAYNSPVGGEASMRNVRSRPSFDLNTHMIRTHRFANHPPHPDSSRHSTNHCNPVQYPNQGQNCPLLERNHVQTSTACHRRTIAADSSNLNLDGGQLLIARSLPSSWQIGGYNHDSSCSRNLAIPPQSFHPTAAQVSGGSTSYPRRFNPTTMMGMGTTVLQQAPLEEGGLHFVAVESYSNRHPRAFTGAGWRNRDRSRSRLSANRYRSLCLDALNHDRPSHEASFNPRSQFDQHRELRLDVDSMSYEELLALGERIGSVSTGLSDDQLSKCLKEMVYLSPDQAQIEDRCVICLEEYQDMSQLGSIKSCSHAYHVGCIKKWLSLKNICPICKSPALSEGDKGKMKAIL